MRPTPAGGLVDVHAHVFLPAHQVPRVTDELAPAERAETVEASWATQTTAGVTQAVLVPLAEEDDYIRETVARLPGRYAGVAYATRAEQGRVPGIDPVAALQDRRRAFPFVGLRTRWLGEPGRPVTDSPMWPTLTAMAEQGIVLWAYLPPDQLALLGDVVAALPDLPVLLNHLGFAPRDMLVDEHRRPRFLDPLPADRRATVLRLAESPRVHVMLSGLYALSVEPPPYEDLWPFVAELRTSFGINRLLWGSDLPWPREVPGYNTLLDAAVQALGDADTVDLSAVFADNARALLGLPVPQEEKR